MSKTCVSHLVFTTWTRLQHHTSQRKPASFHVVPAPPQPPARLHEGFLEAWDRQTMPAMGVPNKVQFLCHFYPFLMGKNSWSKEVKYSYQINIRNNPSNSKLPHFRQTQISLSAEENSKIFASINSWRWFWHSGVQLNKGSLSPHPVHPRLHKVLFHLPGLSGIQNSRCHGLRVTCSHNRKTITLRISLGVHL